MIAEFAELALQEWQAATASVSPALYTVDDRDEVVPFELPGADSAAEKVKRGHSQLRANTYAVQRERLRTVVDLDVVLIAQAFILGNDVKGTSGGTMAMWHEAE